MLKTDSFAVILSGTQWSEESLYCSGEEILRLRLRMTLTCHFGHLNLFPPQGVLQSISDFVPSLVLCFEFREQKSVNLSINILGFLPPALDSRKVGSLAGVTTFHRNDKS